MLAKGRVRSTGGHAYRQVIEGIWEVWDRRNNSERCCDCGLVHKFSLRVTGKRRRIEAKYHRDDKATKAFRKRNGIRILKKKNI
jgi:hypothetical protein